MAPAALRQSVHTCFPALPRLFVNNRRDSARLISSALVLFAIFATQIDQAWAQPFVLFFAVLCLYWSMLYRRFDR
ncbi:MAG: hypothetical protein ACON4T_09050 [Synechococcus sp.]